VYSLLNSLFDQQLLNDGFEETITKLLIPVYIIVELFFYETVDRRGR